MSSDDDNDNADEWMNESINQEDGMMDGWMDEDFFSNKRFILFKIR